MGSTMHMLNTFRTIGHSSDSSNCLFIIYCIFCCGEGSQQTMVYIINLYKYAQMAQLQGN